MGCSGKRKGFSFIEVVVAFGLLSVMVAIFFNLIPSSALASLRAENRLSASNMAQNELETLRSSNFDTLLSVDGRVQQLKRGGTTFDLTTNVVEVPGSNPDHIKLVKVNVRWSERAKEQSLSYELRVFNQNR